MIAQLLLSFDLEDACTEWKTSNYWFNKPSNVNIRVRHRSRSIN